MNPAVEQLPPHLAERTRVIRSGEPNRKGRFVLYWMHHAVRARENPALDTAMHLGNRFGAPVVVYQGLGGRHPYNSDRHHTFILQGAIGVQGELQEREIAYAFHLARDPAARSPLAALAARAMLVATEDFPVTPFPAWRQRLARGLEVPVWAVDCRCVVPMQWHGRLYDRAFQLRAGTQMEYDRRLSVPWPSVDPTVPPFAGDLGFEPLDLETADIAACCAACDIDHTVGPVPETVGGTAAGYVRWEQFKRHGLAGYARQRNDPTVAPPEGVSRLSPYLHYGYVSPFRIAREARECDAEKFLDELLIWRELAHNRCFYGGDVETIAALPDWAQRSLAAHEGDARAGRYSWERLARGQTGDALWDAAQRSLLVHGELHNNVRMTWGKALLRWTRSADEALRLMIDLNHRYALDGSDPNSYGGILWCLGLFDRAFKPEIPIYGSVRTRSTEEHAKRIDLPSYQSRAHRPARRDGLSVGVVGAGMGGLFAARVLADHGLDVAVYEKSRGTGGRLATRRVGDLAFDIGAQYFTVRDERFGRYVDSWVDEGLVQPWEGRFAAVEGQTLAAKESSPRRYVGVSRMSVLSRHLAEDLPVTFQVRVCGVRRKGRKWQLAFEAGQAVAEHDVVVLAIPPAQAAPLLAEASDLAARAKSVVLEPCWAVMAAFDEALPVSFDGVFLNDSALAWAARNNSKPGRPEGESWVIHAAAEWSLNHLEDDGAAVAAAVLKAFFRRLDIDPTQPGFLQAHRWRYAKAVAPLTVGCLWDPVLRIGACGEWCAGSRVEGAVLSGMAMAGRVMGLPDGVRQA